jgi:hypothetical protein
MRPIAVVFTVAVPPLLLLRLVLLPGPALILVLWRYILRARTRAPTVTITVRAVLLVALVALVALVLLAVSYLLAWLRSLSIFYQPRVQQIHAFAERIRCSYRFRTGRQLS